MKLFNLFLNKKKGFTLLETLVSIAIITLVIVGPLSLITASSSYARQTKDVMVANFLAEEATELLQNRYDSLYVLCTKQTGITPCLTDTNEIAGQIAWRVFKESMAATSTYPSCYLDDNSSGCSYDYIDMLDPIENAPARYVATDTECPFLAGVGSTTIFSYVCSGLPSHITGVLTNVRYKRVVKLELLPTFEVGDPRFEQDNDDLRVIVEVSYKSANGTARTIKVVRFIHPRP